MDTLEIVPRRPRLIQVLVLLVGGAAVGTGYAALIGVLTVQSIGARAGARFNLDNQLVAVQDPSTPWVEAAAIALLSAAVVAVAHWSTSRPAAPLPWVAVASAAVTLIVVIAIGMPAPTPIDLFGELKRGVQLGWQGWFIIAGSSPAVHVVAILLGLQVALVVRRSSSRSAAGQRLR